VARFSRFHKSFLAETSAAIQQGKSIDIRSYAKYILKKGSVIEKRKIMSCIKSKIVLAKKVIGLEE